jgi:excisionase family DNA binding protein
MEKRLFNITDASEYLGIPKGCLYKFVWQRRLPFVVKIGKSLRFDKVKMDRWIEEHIREVKNF